MGEGSLAVAETGTQSLSKAEQRKLDSDHLRDPLLSELSNDDVRFTEDAVQLLKFHGSYQQHHRELRKTDKIQLANDAAAAQSGRTHPCPTVPRTR